MGSDVTPAVGAQAEGKPFGRPRPRHRLPSCHGLLDERIREAMWTYRRFGHVGVCMAEAMAYIDLLEEELSRCQAGEAAR